MTDAPVARGLHCDRWPALPYAEWKDTYATLHMWTQVIGKVALALAPPINHSWGIAFQVTPRGLATRRLVAGDRSLAIEFDFLDHVLVMRVSDGTEWRIGLAPKSVAQFYREVMAALGKAGIAVDIWTMPVEIPSPIRFDRDDVHASYEPVYAERCWRILAAAAEVFTRSRCGFIGKASPTHFFWGSFDLAVTRFSGRRAPPREGPAFMREAYSHEVISHGFWPGDDALPEPVFYAYAAPEPAGFKTATIRPAGASYHRGLGEFLLPYDVVRAASSPDSAIETFIASTYEQAATLAGWDRAALERVPATDEP